MHEYTTTDPQISSVFPRLVNGEWREWHFITNRCADLSLPRPVAPDSVRCSRYEEECTQVTQITHDTLGGVPRYDFLTWSFRITRHMISVPTFSFATERTSMHGYCVWSNYGVLIGAREF